MLKDSKIVKIRLEVVGVFFVNFFLLYLVILVNSKVCGFLVMV